MLDARPDLRRGLAFARLLVRVKAFPDAHIAAGGMFAGKAIEQAAVSLAAIAMAIARLLIEDFFDPRGNSISVLHHYIREQRGTQRRRERPLRSRGVKRGHRLLRRSTLRLARSRALRNDRNPQRQGSKKDSVSDSAAHVHPVKHIAVFLQSPEQVLYVERPEISTQQLIEVGFRCGI